MPEVRPLLEERRLSELKARSTQITPLLCCSKLTIDDIWMVFSILNWT
jgi:hypothetical protein